MRYYPKPLTVGRLKEWLQKYHIPDDTPIGIYIGDSERGSIANGVIGETDCIVNDNFEPERTELSGEHCYCKNGSVLNDIDNDFIVMITDGLHCE